MFKTKNNTNPFKMLAESLGLSVADMAILLRIPHGTAQKMAHGERPLSPEAWEAGCAWYRRVDEVALAFLGAPERVPQADIPPILHRAVKRRQQELNILRSKGRKK